MSTQTTNTAADNRRRECSSMLVSPLSLSLTRPAALPASVFHFSNAKRALLIANRTTDTHSHTYAHIQNILACGDQLTLGQYPCRTVFCRKRVLSRMRFIYANVVHEHRTPNGENVTNPSCASSCKRCLYVCVCVFACARL